MEIIKTRFHDKKKYIFILFILITLVSMIFIYNYSFKKNPNESTEFNNIVKEINTLNNSIQEYPTEFNLNNEVTISSLRDNINKLEKIKNDLHALVILDDYTRNASYKVISLIESSQSLYNFCISSLEYQNISTASEHTTKIQEGKFDVLKLTNDLNHLGIEIEFNDDSLIFFDKLINHLNNLDIITKKNNINISQSEKFIKSFKATVNDFSQLVEEIEPAILKVREDNRSFDSILNDLLDKESKYLNLKNDINSISIPEGYLSYYNSLIDTFNLYSNYLKKIKLAIIFEKSSSDYESNKNDIDKNYENAFSKLNDVNDSLKSLNKLIENF